MNIDIDQVRTLYETIKNVWPDDDMWHQYSKKQIYKYINRMKYGEDRYLLNAGSGGNDYGLNCRMVHVDIAENKINNFKEYKVASIEAMPFDSHTFTDVICVGSVINYCDALTAIHELSRVLKPNGSLILEFESSWGYEHRKNEAYKRDAEIVRLLYFGEYYPQWIFSPKYICNILHLAGFEIYDEFRFHFLSGISYSKYQDENRAARYAKFDWLCRVLPIIKRHSSNIIYRCIKR
jgi:ubiquinone/menaquinone biosynthesis C-methylase UbiE